jgi:hypothetical protein
MMTATSGVADPFSFLTALYPHVDRLLGGRVEGRRGLVAVGHDGRHTSDDLALVEVHHLDACGVAAL